MIRKTQRVALCWNFFLVVIYMMAPGRDKRRIFSNASLSRRAGFRHLGCRLPRRERMSVPSSHHTALLRRLCGVIERVSVLSSIPTRRSFVACVGLLRGCPSGTIEVIIFLELPRQGQELGSQGLKREERALQPLERGRCAGKSRRGRGLRRGCALLAAKWVWGSTSLREGLQRK